MSALACFAADKGHAVVGSDRAFDQDPSNAVCRLLKEKNIFIVPQDGEGIDSSFDLAVFSTAVEADRPEVIKARSLNIPSKTRPEYLTEIVKSYKSSAVAGTSGKSTTSGMLAFLMKKLGFNPNFIGGGCVRQFKDRTNPGNYMAGTSDHFVFEACESDGSITCYHPAQSMILNLELDHNSIDETAGMFRELVRNTSGLVLLNADDKNLSGMKIHDAVTFSVDRPSEYTAADVAYGAFHNDFSIRDIRFNLCLPGKYNLYNALSCIAFLNMMDVPLVDIAYHLPEFRGIARRFDIVHNDGKRLVIDDYAHNPHKISSLMGAMKNVADRVCYIFQPHGFGPTKLMKAEYIAAFSQGLRSADHLMLLPIFFAGGTVSRDISSHDLADGIRTAGKSVEVVEDRKEIPGRVRKYDTCVVLGARDDTLSDLARDIARWSPSFRA